MKKIIFLIVMTTILFSCKTTNQPNDGQMVDVTVNFLGIDIQITPEDSPSHLPAASDKDAATAGVKRIALSIFDATTGTLVKSITETNSDPNFGQDTTFRLPVGSYKFVAVAHAVNETSDPVATINSTAEFSLGSVIVGNPTYCTVQDVTVEGNTMQSVSIDMGTRKNSAFAANFLDEHPEDVKVIDLIVSPSSTEYSDLLVNPATGFATAQWQYKKSFDLPALGVTVIKNKTLNLPIMLTAASQQLDVTINALSETSEVLYTRTLENVTLQQAHKTVAKGTFFSPEVTTTFTFDITEIRDTIPLD